MSLFYWSDFFILVLSEDMIYMSPVARILPPGAEFPIQNLSCSSSPIVQKVTLSDGNKSGRIKVFVVCIAENTRETKLLRQEETETVPLGDEYPKLLGSNFAFKIQILRDLKVASSILPPIFHVSILCRTSVTLAYSLCTTIWILRKTENSDMKNGGNNFPGH